ncbi:predicted protein [Plenodomus lingam JN3]|uniref:NAD(P)-binding domain-containing protein n=1 Tax=Leptosphaeria maculans (strain JN3 / isolate v23.1.3 / race Av1-4-5-6-7-8) TaxID=985895 RepID=M1ZMF9_LEPMJ|nr:predicted protein [Plenodomus lingam JN3]
MRTILVVGATRGLANSLLQTYAANPKNRVLTTARTSKPPANTNNVTYIPSIDLESPQAGIDLANYLTTRSIPHIDIIIITAGYFATETFKELSFSAQERMYRTCAIGPTILISALANMDNDILNSTSKIIFISSESGSITL